MGVLEVSRGTIAVIKREYCEAGMTKTLDEVEKFIELRARGMSFDKIAHELQVSKPTLMEWERKYRGRVSEERALELQVILEKHNILRFSRMEAFSSLLSDTLEEIIRRGDSLQSMSTEKLVSLALMLESRVVKEAGVYIESPLEEALSQDIGFEAHLD